MYCNKPALSITIYKLPGEKPAIGFKLHYITNITFNKRQDSLNGLEQRTKVSFLKFISIDLKRIGPGTTVA